MKIGFITNTYPPSLNGVSRSVFQLVTKLEEAGHQTFVVTPHLIGATYPPNVLAVRAFMAPASIRSDLSVAYFYARTAAAYFAKNGVQLIHTHDTLFGARAGIKVARQLSIPAIHSYHTFIERYQYFPMPGYVKGVRWLSRSLCNQYDLVHCPSPKIARYLESIGVTTPVKALINIPINKPQPRVMRDQDMARKLSIGEKDFVYITFGRVAREKGLGDALNILAPILKSHADAKYIIAGSGPDEASLRQTASSLGIGKQVVFTGPFQPEELQALASLSHYFLFTSTTDTQAITLLEAMSFGLPVIAIDDDCVDFILKPELNGFKVPATKLPEVCQLVYQDQALWQQLSKVALESAQEIYNHPYINDYVEMYDSVISGYHPNS